MPDVVDFNNCDFSHATLIGSNSGATYTVGQNLPVYFACAVTGHCVAGQKLTVLSGSGITSLFRTYKLEHFVKVFV